jgi:hypothetical protein
MKRILALQLLACLAMSSADANTITEGPLSFPGGTGNFNNPLTFDKFDTSLGTLTDVTISMTAVGYGILIVNNTANSKDYNFYNGFASVPVNVVGPGGVTISTTLTATGMSGTASPGLTSFNGVSGNYDASGHVLSADWGSYSGLGAGTFTLNALVAGGTFGGSQTENGNSFLFFGGSEHVNGTVTVTYTYTGVPDGGLTAMLLGMGMLGLGCVRRMAK